MAAHLWANGPAPAVYITHKLAERWGVPPHVVRSLPAGDIQEALAISAAESEVQKARMRSRK